MPVKLLGTVALLIIVTIFCGFNLDDEFRCDINLLFHTFRDVPVFLTVLISFFAGVLLMMPFSFGNAKFRAAQKAADAKARQERETARSQAKADAQAKKDADRAERARKAQEKQAKKHPEAAEKAQVTAANEVPVIKPEPAAAK
ncbi:MAG: hypothetical protein K2K67_06900 [Treponemataceae bacterium]|nr:hypothetical protein [Treponemataceae bacterium]